MTKKMLRVSFYSYKGGSGRSTTCWNTVQALVNKLQPTAANPFIIVDTDTESAGATFLYKAKDKFYGSEGKYKSVQWRMTEEDGIDFNAITDKDKERFFSSCYPVGAFFGCDDEAVLLIGVNLDKSNVGSFDATGKSEHGAKQAAKFKHNIAASAKKCGASALIFDTPSGTQNLALLSIRESDITVCCMRPTSQFRESTYKQLEDFIKTKSYEIGNKTFILTPTAVCIDDGQRFWNKDYPTTAHKEIKEEFSDLIGVKLDMLEPTKNKLYDIKIDNDIVFGIPEVRRFKWQEAALGVVDAKELTDNDRLAINRFNYLADTIIKYS